MKLFTQSLLGLLVFTGRVHAESSYQEQILPVLITLSQEITATQGRLNTLSVELRAEMKEGFGKVDQELKNVRAEMREGFGKVDQEFKNVRAEMKEGFDLVGARFNLVDARFQRIEDKLESLFIQNQEINTFLKAHVEHMDRIIDRTEERLLQLESHWSNHLSKDFIENPMTYLSGMLWVMGVKSAGVLPIQATAGFFALQGIFTEQLFLTLFGGMFSKPTEFVGLGISSGIVGVTSYLSYQHATQISSHLTAKTVSIPVVVLVFAGGLAGGDSLAGIWQKVLNVFLPKPR